MYSSQKTLHQSILTLIGLGLILSFHQGLTAQKRPPIIDVHVHAMKVNPNFAAPMCPWFLSNMPGGGPNQAAPSFINLDCVDPLMPATSDADMQEKLLATA
ncbi:amidohydrolase, partial [Robiginitalea sp.]|nr:amidohydrolase [Robiginitalea sp.]